MSDMLIEVLWTLTQAQVSKPAWHLLNAEVGP